MFKSLFLTACVLAPVYQPPQSPPGRLVDLGGHRLHVHCVGRGAPTVLIENGFDEFSSDWVLVQSRLEPLTRTCTYDRAGYAWSDPGPMPRTFAQINLEAERRRTQAHLVQLSTKGEQRIVQAGHDMHLEAPDVVARAIEDVVRRIRN